MDPRNPVMVGMLALLAVSLLFQPTLVAQPVLPLGIENFTSIFRGWDVHLDNKISTVSVIGSSMEPTIGEGDVALHVDFPYENLRVGDVILGTLTNWPDKPLVIHRIIAIDPEGAEGVLTRGDASPDPDKSLIQNEDYHGLIIGVLFTSSPGWHP
jgi:signal peptidase I